MVSMLRKKRRANDQTKNVNNEAHMEQIQDQ